MLLHDVTNKMLLHIIRNEMLLHEVTNETFHNVKNEMLQYNVIVLTTKSLSCPICLISQIQFVFFCLYIIAKMLIMLLIDTNTIGFVVMCGVTFKHVCHCTTFFYCSTHCFDRELGDLIK